MNYCGNIQWQSIYLAMANIILTWLSNIFVFDIFHDHCRHVLLGLHNLRRITALRFVVVICQTFLFVRLEIYNGSILGSFGKWNWWCLPWFFSCWSICSGQAEKEEDAFFLPINQLISLFVTGQLQCMGRSMNSTDDSVHIRERRHERESSECKPKNVV